MSTVCNRRVFAIAVLLLGVATVRAGDGLAPATEAPETPYNIGFDQKLGDKIPLDLKFVGEDGSEVTLAQCVNGKPTILILAWYMCPNLCNEVLVGVLDACRKMKLTCGKDFNIVAVSIDPKEHHELAQKKKWHFVAEYGRKEADWGWKFLTGKEENIKQLADAVGFRYVWDKMLKEFKHASGITIVTPEGVISRYLPGIEYLDRGANGQLLEDQTSTLNLSLVEAGNGKIGTLAERMFLSCYRFDPHRGKYSLSVMWIMRAGGLLTLLIIAGFYARVAWKVPGGRLLVVGILIYVTMLPLIMYTRFSVDWIPKSAGRAAIVPIGLIAFFVGRWIWRSANAGGQVEVPTATNA